MSGREVMTTNQRRLRELLQGEKDAPWYNVASCNREVRDLLQSDPSAALGCNYKMIIFLAIRCEAPLAAFELICNATPGIAQQKDERFRMTPLVAACNFGATLDVVRFLYGQWPESMTSICPAWGYETPLHYASECSSKEIVAFLADKHPEGLKIQNSCVIGQTPLKLACLPRDEQLDVIKVLVERYPEAVGDSYSDYHETPLEYAQKQERFPPQILELLRAVQSLLNLSQNDQQEATRILERFRDMEWSGGMALVLGKFPSIADLIDLSLMPQVLSLVGKHHGALDSLYVMLKEKPDLFKVEGNGGEVDALLTRDGELSTDGLGPPERRDLQHALDLTATAVPDHLKCGICHQVVSNAVLIPWDSEGRSCCETCILPNAGLRKETDMFIQGVMEKMEGASTEREEEDTERKEGEEVDEEQLPEAKRPRIEQEEDEEEEEAADAP